ncbi:hypothetical protein Q6348_04790 [Isoptericola sp. b441]|uniref:Ferredoxin n=1 Tax=Actinotalea lenta TaxID=3064654 RepID=A0ABT9D7H7_9CELL|nr:MULTISPECIES: hypothetical protein [unclassified Isoptericola]MDO8106510.1 hypothetical protein [Isoptericola sp. b441]MDO8121774.1 hypothetical protein [Isoptericola sp. b490]
MTDTAQSTPMTTGSRHRNDQQDRASFYLTGHRMDTHLGNVEGLGLRSAHFAPYRRLTELRYDYPLVLADGHDVNTTMWSLSGLIDDLRVATGEDAGRIRHHAILLEREIRVRADAGSVRLSAAWDEAVDALIAASANGGEPDPDLADSLARLTTARTVDGRLVTCDHDTPREVVGHLWGLVQRERERHLTARVAHLRDDLQDILDAEQASSPAGLSGERLAASLGPVVGAELDTEALSRLLTDNRPRFSLSDSRRARIRRLLDVLTTQRFVPSGEDDDTTELYDFVYTDVQAALAAHRDRFAATTELAKALVMAEMEADGRYREEVHDALFAKWSVADLDTDTLELFPEYLVRVDAESMTSEDSVALLEALASGLPIKALVQVNDLLRGATQQARPAQAGLSARMLASTALASGESFVMQCASSALYHARDRIVAGSAAPGAALFVVYSGEGEWLDDLPPYLAAAAAIESRVFPSYAYDPGAGETWADRFTLGCNPQPELDWPVRRITYQDGSVQRVSLDVPFTAADFWACDARLVTHLALAAEDGSEGKEVPFAEHMASNPGAWAGELPYLLMISRDERLHRVLVDRPLIHLTQRSVEQWHRLQELAGIHNSHVALERARMREELEAELAAAGVTAGTAVPATSAAAPATPPVADNAEDQVDEPQAHDPYLPWIETARCATCNECTAINDRMFRYNDDRQAYIADPDAGTYAELVLAAEACQVAIIHPGQPRNPDEPGLAELTKRAEAFA